MFAEYASCLPAVFTILHSLHCASIHDRWERSVAIAAVHSIGIVLTVAASKAYSWRRCKSALTTGIETRGKLFDLLVHLMHLISLALEFDSALLRLGFERVDVVDC